MKRKLQKNKIKLTKDQIAENKKRTSFSKQIHDSFVFSGFDELKVHGYQFELGNRQNELDHCYLYENVMVICEDTIRAIQAKEKAESKGQLYNRNHKLEKMNLQKSSMLI